MPRKASAIRIWRAAIVVFIGVLDSVFLPDDDVTMTRRTDRT